MNTIPHIKENDKIILFDGICKLCNTWYKLVIRYDNRHILKFISMQSKKGQEILNHLSLPINSFKSILFIENNIVYEKSTAILKVISHLPFPIKFLMLLKLIPKFFRDYIYTKIAKNRYKWFGKVNKCILPLDKGKEES